MTSKNTNKYENIYVGYFHKILINNHVKSKVDLSTTFVPTSMPICISCDRNLGNVNYNQFLTTNLNNNNNVL